MSDRRVVIGTRGSELALWQARWAAARLTEIHPGLHVETRVIKTTGDKILDSPLSKIGDKGLFTKEIERALLDKSIDLAVHSLKDLPTAIVPGLTIGAICEREDVRDVFIANPKKRYRSFADVPKDGTIATGSLRRKCQLLSLRPGLSIIDIRGNLKTRREKLEQSGWDGMILALAGVKRLGWSDIVTEILPVTMILPAVGQGALAIEIREGDEQMRSFVSAMHHVPTALATEGERALLRKLEGGCQVPIGTYGRIADGRFSLDAMVGSTDGKEIIRGSIEGSPSDSGVLGTRLAETLLKQGADKILEQIRKVAPLRENVGREDIIV